jgi:hypothetical protein
VVSARFIERRSAMSSSRSVNLFDPRGERRELLGLIRRIQALTLEVKTLRQLPGSDPELPAKERTLDQLRWRLAVVARRAATNDVGAAA